MNATAFPPPKGAPSLSLPAGVSQTPSSAKLPALSRNATIALSVVGLHVLFIWGLQSGLLIRAAEIIVPVEVLSQFIEPPAPKVQPAPPTPPKPVKTAIAKAPAQPAPQPLAIADPTPSPNAPVGVTTPQPVAVAPIAAPVAAVAVAPAAPPAAVQLPSSDASYLQNPKPAYPPISRRLNEQGKTTVRVLIAIDGAPQKAEIATSSGYERLDQAAITAVMRWRYVPGKRGGVPEAMWFNIPINWVLE